MKYLTYVIIPFLIALLSFGFIPAAAAQSSCYKNPSFAKKVGVEQAQPLLDQLLKIDNEAVAKTDRLDGMYQADINNDGKLEDVLVLHDTSGSMGLLTIVTLQHGNKKSKNLGPPKPDDARDGPFYFDTYTNADTGNDEFLTQLCGKTYMIFAARYHYRNAYLWKDGKTQNACDRDWVNHERDSFQQKYNKHLYNEAYGQLKFYANKCQKKLEPNIALWIQNDLALAAQKIGDTNACLDHVKAIEADPAFVNASPALKKAVAFNAKLCMAETNKPAQLAKPLGRQEFAWISDKNLSYEAREKLLPKLVMQVVPGGTPADLFGMDYLTDTFANELLARIGAPSAAEIKDGRYGIASAWVPHDATLRGFLWVDIQEGTAVVGFIQGNTIAMTSKFYNAKTLPQAAKQSIKALADDIFKDWKVDLTTVDVIFYDIEKKSKNEFPYAWLSGKAFEPYRTSAATETKPPEKSYFDTPHKTIANNLGPQADQHGQVVTLHCYIYPQFVVLELHAQDDMGSTLKLRYLPKDGNAEDVCKKDFSGTTISFPGEGNFKGVIGDYLFLAPGEDIFGDIGKFAIYDAKSGKKLFATKYKDGTLTVAKGKDKISISYYQQLKTVCNPSMHNPSCWNKVLLANNIAADVTITAPDCREAYKAYPQMEQEYPDGSGLQITAKVHINDITQPQPKFVSGDSTCTYAP